MFTPAFSSAVMHARKNLMPVINVGKPGSPLGHPASKAARIFCDSATRSDIEPLLRAGMINGITTNPTLLKKAGAKSWGHAKEIMKDLCGLLNPHPVSLELTELTEDKMVEQASELAALGSNSIIKVPCGGYAAVVPGGDPFTGMKVVRRLWEKGIKTNVTLVFNTTQAFWAANAGATYISPFLGRVPVYLARHDDPKRPSGNSLYWMEDSGDEKDQKTANSEFVASGGERRDAGPRLIFEIATVFANYQITAEILAASIRNPAQLTECLLAGADILTVPAAVLKTVADHPLSDEGMKSFLEDSKTFSG
jgi:transaldolase